MRILNLAEINCVAGGGDDASSSDIIVTANSDHDYNLPDDPQPGSGAGDAMAPYQAAQHDKECSMQSGSAVQIAHHVMGQDGNQQVTTSTGQNWNNVEFSAVIVQNGDKFGAMNSEIYSENSPNGSAIPTDMPSNAVGIWHNHPLRGDDNVQRLDMFPSQSDWNDLQSIADQTSDKNPAMFLTDGHGVTREFDLSEKSNFYNKTSSELSNPNNQSLLSGRERTQHC